MVSSEWRIVASSKVRIESSLTIRNSLFAIRHLRVPDQLTQRAACGSENLRQLRRQIGERDGRRDQAIESGIVQQGERGGTAAGNAPACTMRGRHMAHLTRHQPQALAVERAA